MSDATADRHEIAVLMRRMSEGSHDAVFEFLELCRPDLERVVRSIVLRLNRRDILRSEDNVGSLAVAAALVLFKRAGAWRSDGALPWVWGWKSIQEAVVAEVGHRTVEYDDGRRDLEHQIGPRPDSAANDIDLVELASRHDLVAGWIEAVDEVASDRDRDVHLEYLIQKHLGDPSPALTVAAMFDLSAPNVRQINHRVGKRLRTHGFASRPGAERLLGVG